MTLSRTCKRCGWFLFRRVLLGSPYWYCNNTDCYYHTNTHP